MKYFYGDVRCSKITSHFSKIIEERILEFLLKFISKSTVLKNEVKSELFLQIPSFSFFDPGKKMHVNLDKYKFFSISPIKISHKCLNVT